MVRKAFLPVFVILLLLGLAANVAAQGALTGSVQGTIKDSDGAVLPGATVTAASDVLMTGRMVAVADEQGGYRFPSLPPGSTRSRPSCRASRSCSRITSVSASASRWSWTSCCRSARSRTRSR